MFPRLIFQWTVVDNERAPDSSVHQVATELVKVNIALSATYHKSTVFFSIYKLLFQQYLILIQFSLFI